MKWKAWIALGALLVVQVASHCPGVDATGWVNSLKPAGPPTAELSLAKGGIAQYSILLSQQPTTQEQKAAEDLAHWLKEMTGGEFPVVQETSRGANDDHVISIGNTELAVQAGLPEVSLGGEGYQIEARGSTLFLRGGSTRGIINAVYVLLEEDLGCRWYTVHAHAIPYASDLVLSVVPRSYVPVLTDRRDPYYSIARDATWAMWNRTLGVDVQVPEKWGGYAKPLGLTGFVHSFNNIMPPSEFFETHPEYFMLAGDVRTPRQWCLTNPDVQRLVIERIRAALAKEPNARIVDVSPNDGGGICQCDACTALNKREESGMGTLLTFVNAVADAVKDDYPQVRVTTLAYLDTVVPPKTVRPRDNVLIWLCTDSHAWEHLLLFVWETEKFNSALKGWSAIGAKMVIWDYPIDYHNYMQPLPNMPVVTENIRYYIKHGATGVFLQAQHNATYGVDREFMRSWVWAKQLWDPSRDTQALIRDFNYGFYGKAAEPLQRYDELLWKTWENLHANVPRLKELDKKYGPGAAGAFLTPQFIDQAMKLMQEAEVLAAGDEQLLSRIRLAKLPILYVICERGADKNLAKYLATLDEFQAIAIEHDAQNITSGLRGPTRDEIIARWRSIALADASKLDFYPLGNEWKFKPDRQEEGIDKRWFAPLYDDRDWTTIRSDIGKGWDGQGFAEYYGYGWYRQQIDVPREILLKPNLRLFFGGIDEQAEIYINGTKAFEHTCQSTGLTVHDLWDRPVEFDPKTLLKPGKNTLAIRVHNNLGMGGIWKPAYLIAGDDIDPSIVEELIAAKKSSK